MVAVVQKLFAVMTNKHSRLYARVRQDILTLVRKASLTAKVSVEKSKITQVDMTLNYFR